jgi:predicted transcriptional regulator
MAAVGRIGREETIFMGSAGVVGMPMSEGKKKREIVQNTLRLAICSELRRGILISLREGKKALSELRTELEISSTTAIHALRELEKNNLVFQDEARNYALTKIGDVIALKLSDFIDAIKVLKKHKDFWLTHDLSGIPPHLLEKIGWLKDSNVVKIDALDIIKTHKTYINSIGAANWVKGVSSIFSPDYPNVFEVLAKKNIDTHLILTESVWEKVIEAAGLEDLKYQLSKGYLDISITEEDARVAFTVTDAFLSLGLFTPDGTYDNTCDLTSTDNISVRWGVELFEHYLKKAKKFLI